MKNRIKKSIVEANIVANIDSIDKVMPKLGKDDTIKLVDEARDKVLGAGYTHFAIFKKDNKIATGWDYKSLYDKSEKKFDDYSIKEYSKEDLINDFPENKLGDFKIVTRKILEKNNINPSDTNNWFKIEENEIREDDFERSSNSVNYGQSEPEMGDEAWEELYNYMRKEKGIEEGSEEINGNKVNTEKLRNDVTKFIDKLNLPQFDNIISKIDKPQEKAEIIAAFAEKIGVPRAKLGSVINSLRNLGENKSILSKNELIESVKKSGNE